MKQLGTEYNLVVCQKSKVADWHEHFKRHYDYNTIVYDKILIDKLTISGVKQIKKELEFMNEENVIILKSLILSLQISILKKIIDIITPIIKQQTTEYIKKTMENYIMNLPSKCVIVINYDSVWLRMELLKLKNFTLMLDESQNIKNASAKRTKFILKLKPDNVILLSGTPVGGKYEEIHTQCKLLGWDISKQLFWDTYINYRIWDNCGIPIKIVTGYKNVDRLKEKLREHGAIFQKTEEVFELPEQIDTNILVPSIPEYRKFKKDRVVKIDDTELIGDTTLTQLLYLRQLAGLYNKNKYEAVNELIESSLDRFVIFYNFKEEFNKLKELCKKTGRPVSYVNGLGTDLTNYNTKNDSITLVQYQSGSSGINLQLANKIIYFSLPLSSEMYQQSRKRIHRLGQSKTCFYYYILSEKSIEFDIKQTLEERRDFTDELFRRCD